MLGRLIEWSVRNVFLVLVMALAIVAGGIYALTNTPLDAQPDLSDVQVIVFTEYPGQAPQVVEDQVTYPLTSAMLTVPQSRVVRGFSFWFCRKASWPSRFPCRSPIYFSFQKLRR